MENLIDRFIAYMLDIGLISEQKAKSEIFILKRRYALLQKQEVDKTPNGDADTEPMNMFVNFTQDILCDFFEERAEEVTKGIVERWAKRETELVQAKQVTTKMKADCIYKSLDRIFNQRLRVAFDEVYDNLGLSELAKLNEECTEERNRRIVAESSLNSLQRELEDALDRIAKMERKEQKRVDRKKRKIAQQRREQFNLETSRSLTVDKTPVKTEDESESISPEKGLHLAIKDFDPLVELSHKKNRRTMFSIDQRGSVNTDLRHKRLEKRLVINRSSVARSTSSRGRTEFSFHPSINYNSKWKPKYDDHHNHKKMWSRMHKENEKIMRKKRLMSEQRKLEEIANCTFTPELVTKRYNETSKEPLDVKRLSLRLYEYADKFKEKRDKLKEQLDSERGEEIRFTPKLETTRSNSQLEVIKERKNVYENLYEDYQKREAHKQNLKNNYYSNTAVPPELTDQEIFLTVQRPITVRGKHRVLFDSLGNQRKRQVHNGIKYKQSQQPKSAQSFSTNLYSEARNSKSNLHE